MARRLSRRALADFVVSAVTRGDDLKTVARQLAAYLVQSRRTKELDLIVRDIEYRLADYGFVAGTVTTAFAIGSETKAQLTRYVTELTQTPRVSLAYQQDPAVIGGYLISLPGKELNRTVHHQLTQLKTRFKKV